MVPCSGNVYSNWVRRRALIRDQCRTRICVAGDNGVLGERGERSRWGEGGYGRGRRSGPGLY